MTRAGRPPTTPHSPAHRRATDHGSLHGDAAAGRPGRLPRGIRPVLVEIAEAGRCLDEPALYAQVGEVSEERLSGQ